MKQQDGQQKHEVYRDKGDILRVIYHGDFDEADGSYIYYTLASLSTGLQKEGKDVNILADTREMGSHTEESRRYGFLIREHVPFSKMAIVVSPKAAFTRRISEILSSGYKHKKLIKYFRSPTWAEKWLKG